MREEDAEKPPAIAERSNDIDMLTKLCLQSQRYVYFTASAS
jgi:hypothetical protein